MKRILLIGLILICITLSLNAETSSDAFGALKVHTVMNSDRLTNWLLDRDTIESIEKGDIRAFLASPDILFFIDSWENSHPLPENIYSTQYAQIYYMRYRFDSVAKVLKEQLENGFDMYIYPHTELYVFRENRNGESAFSELCRKQGKSDEEVMRFGIHIHYSGDGKFTIGNDITIFLSTGNIIERHIAANIIPGPSSGWLDRESRYEED